MLRTAAAPPSLPFDPLVGEWFARRFREPTKPQRLGWPHIVAGRHTLIAAPTGSGKTLAAFLAAIDRLVVAAREGALPETTQVVYVSPLKALSNDIHRNLVTPLAEIREVALELGIELPPIRAAVRTGDTPSAERQAMLRRPPHILVTTPESLYLMVTSQRAREMLRDVRTVIVDEIHALARDKRGSHLALTLERLAALCDRPPARIGLSATQRPMEQIAGFLVGSENLDAAGRPRCEIIDIGHLRTLDLAVQSPPTELSAVCSNEQWDEIYTQLAGLIESHRSTLVFVNTRRLAERVAHKLMESLGPEAVASHHGSLSREIRLSAEERLKSGELRAIVATASLEMGIDVGLIDLVCQIGTPRSIATLLQRVGRSGHSLGAVPKGRLIPLTRDELIECLAIVRAVKAGRLDRIEIPQAPLDVAAQQMIAMAACEEWDEADLFAALRRAWPFRDLSREDFEALLVQTSEGVAANSKHGAYLHRDRIAGRVRARRGARIAAITSGGTIPETGDFRVVTDEDRNFVGTVNEDFAIESIAGDVFLLGNNSWRIKHVRGGEVVVTDAHGAAATVPFWLGEAPGRTIELSKSVSDLREEIAGRVRLPDVESGPDSEPDVAPAMAWLRGECNADEEAARQAALYVAIETAALGVLPTQDTIVFERFFDESGGMQLVIHAPLGARINRAWGLALRKRFCRSFDFELQASATDNGILLSLGPQHSFAIDVLFKMLNTQNGEYLLTQALLAAPMFQTRWRWNVTRALAVLRQQGGKPVPPFLQRFRSDDLLASVFPETVGCLENHSGDVEIPDHPLVRQTMHDCLHEAMDLPGWLDVLRRHEAGQIRFVARDTREPSPFTHEVLNAQPYAFLDDAPLEERRVRAVSARRTLTVESMRDLGRLDPESIREVVLDAWPVVRDADEMHDALLSLGMLRADEAASWRPWFEELVAAGRATTVRRANEPDLWIAAERWPAIAAVFPTARPQPAVTLPEGLAAPLESAPALVLLLRGRLQSAGPTTAEQLAAQFGLDEDRTFATLEALEGEGQAMRGCFTAPRDGAALAAKVEWCDRRLLARIHRLTLEGLRKQIEPVSVADYVRFLARHHRLTVNEQYRGVAGLQLAIEQLQGFEMAAGAWEDRLLPGRVSEYSPALLDQLSMSGVLVWGRVKPPVRDPDQVSAAGLTRAVSISLALRHDLACLLPVERDQSEVRLRGNAALVLETLERRGALFYHELKSTTQLLESHLDDALQELAAAGLVTADTFGAVRWIASRDRAHQDRLRRRARWRGHGLASPATSGRWSTFPGHIEPPRPEDRLAFWAKLLLNRWGVVFRDLLARETLAPRWGELLGVYRRMEARGEIRGGRFIRGVAGEQYALGSVVEQLRAVRDEEPDGCWLVISAVDPLNLTGIITQEPRVPAIHTYTLALADGRLIASRQAGEVQYHAEIPGDRATELTRRLRRHG